MAARARPARVRGVRAWPSVWLCGRTPAAHATGKPQVGRVSPCPQVVRVAKESLERCILYVRLKRAPKPQPGIVQYMYGPAGKLSLSLSLSQCGTDQCTRHRKTHFPIPPVFSIVVLSPCNSRLPSRPVRLYKQSRLRWLYKRPLRVRSRSRRSIGSSPAAFACAELLLRHAASRCGP